LPIGSAVTNADSNLLVFRVLGGMVAPWHLRAASFVFRSIVASGSINYKQAYSPVRHVGEKDQVVSAGNGEWGGA